MKADIGLVPKHSEETALLLNKLLADEYVLYTKTKFYHWNVEGPDFHSIHLFFDEQAEKLEEIIDAVAERTRAIGHFSSGTLKTFLGLTRLLEGNEHLSTSGEMIKDLLSTHETLIKELRQDVEVIGSTYKDAGTSDFLTGIMEQHEAMGWMLRAFLK